MLFSALFVSSVVSLATTINSHQGASFAIADAGDVQAVQVAGGYQGPSSYNYVPNLATPGGTVYGSDGSTTQIVPNMIGNGGYTAYGSNGSRTEYVPNIATPGGTFYSTPGSDE